MIEQATSCFREYLVPPLKAGVVMIMSVPEEVKDLMEERKYIIDDIRVVERAAKDAEDAKDSNTCKRRKERVKQLREIDFRIEDVIDEWKLCCLRERENKEERKPRDCGCLALVPCENANLVNSKCCGRVKMAYDILKIKKDLPKIIERIKKDGINIRSSSKQGQSSSERDPDVEWKDLRRIPVQGQMKIEGFKAPSNELINWLEEKRTECTVMVVVGMAGQGKTTLAQKVFDDKKLDGKFDCKAWINVSDFDAPDKFFRSMLRKLDEKKEKSLPDAFPTMGLKNEVQKYLHGKRYILFFDDVWNKKILEQIEPTVCNNGYGSRIIITTRNKEVAKSCKKSDIEVKVHEMQPLTVVKALKLFSQTALKFASNDQDYREQVEELSPEIVETCDGLPLGIVAIGKHVRVLGKDAREWKSKIEEAGIKETLSLSYDNLPHHLRPCLLYFGIYPQDSKIKSKRLIRQWIAEGFINHEKGKTLEKVAKEYLTSLIDRNLVQVSSFTIHGKPRSCRVHYLVHDMIVRRFEDLSFCRCINEEYLSQAQPDMSGITRHLSIATNSIEKLPVDKTESPFIRSLHFFTKEELPKPFVGRIVAECKLLKVFDFEESGLSEVPEDLGNLIHLKYLSFRKTKIRSLPKSIGKLQNLETLDLRKTAVNEMPKEISKLGKLRHLLAMVQLKDGIGGMRYLQTLRDVKIDDGVGSEGIEKELGKLSQIRDLGLTNVGKEHGSALCSSINKMKHLEKLHIVANSENGVIDLKDLKKPPMLQKLCLQGKLNNLPDWDPNLVLSGSKLIGGPLNSLKNLSSLLFLSITKDACESLHFEDEEFKNLKELELGSLHSLSSITIDSKALPSLKKLQLRDIPQLKEVPPGIQHLEKLEDLNIQNMPIEFKQGIAPDGGQEQKIIKHVPRVRINGELVKDKNEETMEVRRS